MTDSLLRARLLAALPEPLRADAERRFDLHGERLAKLLAALYGDAEPWTLALFAGIGELMAARPTDLLAQDRAREAQPEWFTSSRMLGYSAYVDRFGGTLQGVEKRIGHLEALGVTYLHLLPFLRARAGDNDGGFAVASFDEVEPTLGSVDDLEALTASLRAAGISLCADLILNHVADDHAWAEAAKRGDAGKRAYFHVFADRAQADRYEATLAQVFPRAAPGNFTWVEAMGGWVWTTFYPYQWDLNYANPAVFAEMALAMLRLANRGIEVFRLDSTAYLWKREGTPSMNQPEAHLLLQALRAIVDIAVPGVLLKAEAIVPTRELPAYLGQGERECHLAYHSTLMAAGWAAMAEEDTTLLYRVAEATPALPEGASWLTYVRCHDDIGWKVLADEARSLPRLAAVSRFYNGGESFAAGAAFQAGDDNPLPATNGMAASLAGLQRAATDEERELALRRLLLLHGLALSFGGMPVLYMGDELAMMNDPTADCSIDSRWMQRPYFDDARLQDPVAVAWYAQLRQLIAERASHTVLAAGQPRTMLAGGPPQLLAMLRGDRLLNLSNFSGQPITVELAALGAGSWPNERIELAAWSMTWLTR